MLGKREETMSYNFHSIFKAAPAAGVALTALCSTASAKDYEQVLHHALTDDQYRAFPGVRGKGMTSRTFERPVT